MSNPRVLLVCTNRHWRRSPTWRRLRDALRKAGRDVSVCSPGSGKRFGQVVDSLVAAEKLLAELMTPTPIPNDTMAPEPAVPVVVGSRAVSRTAALAMAEAGIVAANVPGKGKITMRELYPMLAAGGALAL